MLKRTISGAVFVMIIVAFLILRQFVDYRLFNILPWFFSIVGTFEIARAMKKYLLKGVFLIIIIYGALFLPHYALIEYFIFTGYGVYFALSLAIIAVILTVIYALIKRLNFKLILVNCLGLIYPTLFTLSMVLVNDLNVKLGFIAIVMIFAIAPCTDTFAYLVGLTYKKIRKGKVKPLCPKLSPKKTVAGAIGGLLGGAISSMLVYFIFNPQLSIKIVWLFFLTVGVIASILTQIGDLFESYIKRKVGIKDIGNIMPGHGGVMDRIDGISFVSALIYIVFLTVI